jgi:hypothetical protein
MLVYIAGPYSDDPVANIAAAREVNVMFWSHGIPAICPHMNTAHMERIASDEVFYRGYIDILLRCDAVVTFGNWRISRGAMKEVEIAKQNNIPVYESWGDYLETCKRFLRNEQASSRSASEVSASEPWSSIRALRREERDNRSNKGLWYGTLGDD